jgi:hypothetical protein
MPFRSKRLIPIALGAVALAGLVVALPGTSALAALPQGAKAPDFSTQAVLAGKPFAFHLGDALKKGPVVLYFSRRPSPAAAPLRPMTFPMRPTHLPLPGPRSSACRTIRSTSSAAFP